MYVRLWMIPVLIAISYPLTLGICYFIAIEYGHAQEFIPFISDTGSIPPESCIFAQSLNLTALLIAMVMYFRHNLILEFHRHSQNANQRILQCSSFFVYMGYVAAFGMSMVGNFQQSSWLLFHALGALMAFGCGLFYSWGQTWISYQMQTVMHDRITCHVRLIISILSAIVTIGGVYGMFGSAEYTRNGTLIGCGEALLTAPNEPNYTHRLITTGSEWALIVLFIMNLMTYAVELRYAVIMPPILKLNLDAKGHYVDQVAIYVAEGLLARASPKQFLQSLKQKMEEEKEQKKMAAVCALKRGKKTLRKPKNK